MKAAKISIFGDGAVGKTTLVKRYIDREFLRDYLPTMGIQFAVKYISLALEENQDPEDFEIHLWDLAGQEKFKFIRRQFFQGSIGGIAVCDVIRPETLENLKNWISDLLTYCPGIPIVLFGNKIDIEEERKVAKEDLEKFMRNQNLIGFFETSAKTGAYLDEAFELIIRRVLIKFREQEKSVPKTAWDAFS